jgi:cell division transport system ATP-binding protein
MSTVKFLAVSKTHASGSVALNDLSCEIAQGEMVFIAGHSGAGKSSLLKLVALIERVSHGQVLVDGEDLAQFQRRDVARHRAQIGLVFQDHRLLMDRTVFDNVALPLVVLGIAHADIARRVRSALDKVGLDGKERMQPASLSGGEQQRVGIARALVSKPKLLLADEPTGNLDPELSAEIMQLFVDLNRDGSTVMVASHDLRLIQKLKKRVLVLKQGQLIDDFRPELLPKDGP